MRWLLKVCYECEVVLLFLYIASEVEFRFKKGDAERVLFVGKWVILVPFV